MSAYHRTGRTWVTPTQAAAWWQWWRVWRNGWLPPTPNVIHACIILLGWTEADVRDFRYYWDQDMIEVRRWDGRRADLTGYDLFRVRP